MKIVVRAPNWVGDAVLSLPAMNAIKKNFPESEIWVAAEEWVKDLFTMDDTFAGTVSLSKHAGFKALAASARGIRDGRFDLGILFTNSFASALVFALAGIPQRWGYKKDGRGFLLTRGIPVRPKTAHEHQARYYQALLTGLGLKDAPDDFTLSVDRQEITRTEEWLKSRLAEYVRESFNAELEIRELSFSPWKGEAELKGVVLEREQPLTRFHVVLDSAQPEMRLLPLLWREVDVTRLDDLVGPQQKRLRNGYLQCASSSHVEHSLEFRRPFDRQFTRVGATQDFASKDAGQLMQAE